MALDAIRQDDVTLDGEAVIFDKDGHSAFSKLRSREAGYLAQMVVFDIPVHGGADTTKLPWIERRALLEDLELPPAMVLSEVFEQDGNMIFEYAVALGAEGMVSKRIDRTYRAGRSSSWQKTRNPHFRRR